MDPWGKNWFLKEEEKKKERIKRNKIHKINHQLQILVKRLSSKIEPKEYEDFVSKLESHYQISGCTLWNLSWANNYESGKVAIAQALLITHIVKQEDHNLGDIQHFQHEADILMRHLGHLDWACYLEYNQKKSLI